MTITCLLAACTPAGETDRRADVPSSPKPPVRAQRGLGGGVVYDDFCAQHDPPPSDLVASYAGEGTVVISSEGEEIARLPGRPPIEWSASGALLAVGPAGSLWTWEGERYEGTDVPLELTGAGGASWAWSPSGDCALTLAGGSLGAFHTGAGANSTTLVRKGVEAAAWGPRGRVVVVVNDGGRPSLWIADLKTSRRSLVSELESDTCCVVLGGWTREGEALYWAGPGSSAMQDGWPLQTVDERGRTRTWGRTLPHPNTIAVCGDRVVALTGSDRYLKSTRVSLLTAEERAQHLTAPSSFHGVACSPDGRSVVVWNDSGPSVVPLDDSHPPNPTDVYPEWGPRSIQDAVDWTGTPPSGLLGS